jgi:hypothetical protein
MLNFDSVIGGKMKKARPKKTRKGEAKDDKIKTIDRDEFTGYPMFVGA